jgi:ABC-type branched-subunit amino acid transport system ATPase component
MSLNVQGVVVRYDGVMAVDGVELELPRGRIVSVIGPNGSGKSSLFNAISGLAPMQGGSVATDGIDISAMTATQRVQIGLARTFQTPRFDPHITVRTAITCGFYPKMNSQLIASMLRLPATQRNEARARDEYEKIVANMSLAEISDIRLGELPMGQIRLVEVARAIASGPSYLLLDEPAAGLSGTEQQILAAAIRNMAERNIGVLLVEHNFNLVKNLAEHVVVLNRGRVLATGTAAEMAEHPEVINVYLGGETTQAA